ncbi:MAG: pilus assembly protein [Lachnospiraceae bacterium]|nr:pilus assembly protein [Lachnospiraceae bacterium]
MTQRGFRVQGSFTVEAAMLMCVILPVLLALLYLGMFLHDKGVLNGAAQEVAATADLNRFRNGGNARLARKADQLADRTGASGKAKSSVQVTDHEVSASYSASMKLPGLLPKLFGKGTLDTGADVTRILPDAADTIRKIRGLEYVSAMLAEG